jgi:hypothetical protein
MQWSENRAGAVCAIAGGALLFLGTYIHPQQADPNNALAAFTEYAASQIWVTSHLLQLAGFILIGASLLLLARELEAGGARQAARLAGGGVVASVALAAALQAVDGIALKNMVDAWSGAPATEKRMAFYAALAVRQVEVGLAAALCILFGATMTIFGAALWRDRAKWLGVIGGVVGVLMIAAGIAMAHTGFSGLAMAIQMPADLILLVWLLLLSAWLWRRGAEQPSPVDDLA